MKVAILDYGVANIGSLFNMLKKIGVQPEITNNIAILKNADALILPSGGAFDNYNGLRKIDKKNNIGLFYFFYKARLWKYGKLF